MAKEKNTSFEEEKEVETKPEVTLTRYLLGSYIDPIRNEWMLGYAKFDPATGTIGKFEKERVAGDFEVMKERLQIKTIKLGLYSPNAVTEEEQ